MEAVNYVIYFQTYTHQLEFQGSPAHLVAHAL
jgi:hypothetical protein